MKITRALLLSSKKQAEAWERATFLFFSYSRYRFLATMMGEEVQFQIFCVHQETGEDKRSVDVVATDPHVSKTFPDTDQLITFLEENQIDLEIWQPIEDKP